MSFLSGMFKKKSTDSVIKKSKAVDSISLMLPIKEIYYEKETWDIGINVQSLREAKGLTQKQLAELLGYKSAGFISRLELWRSEKITYEQVETLAKHLDVDIERLLRLSK